MCAGTVYGHNAVIWPKYDKVERARQGQRGEEL